MVKEVEKPLSTSSDIATAIKLYTDSDDFHKHAKSKNSKYAYKADLASFQRYLASEGVLSLGEISPDHISGWVRQMLVFPLSPATVKRRLTPVRRFLRRLGKRGISQDLIVEIPIVETRNSASFEALGKDKYLALVRHLRKEGEVRDLAIAELLVSTGADSKEISDMSIGDISKSKDGVMVARFVKPRTGKERTIALNDETAQALGEYLAQRKDRKSSQPLFTHFRNKRRLKRGGLWFALNNYRTVIGVGELSPRILKNTFVNNFEGDVKSLADVMGVSEFSARKLYQKRLAN